jgi:integrase
MLPKLNWQTFENDQIDSDINDTITLAMKNTLGQVILLYWRHGTVQRRTARNNALALLKIIEKVKGHKVQPEVFPLAEINASLIMEYQSAVLASHTAQALDVSGQREARERALRSTRSTITQARSLFSRRGEVDLIDVYQRAGVEIPNCVIEFCTTKVRGRSTRSEYQAPPDEIVRNSMDSIELMKADRNLYLSFWLALGAGLRRGEIALTKWEFIREVDGHPRLIGGIGKTGEMINVPIQTRAYQAILPFKQDSGPIISERGDQWARRLSHWMRLQGWTSRLLLHDLRAYSGSLIYAKKGPVQAMRFLRHRSVRTTELHYVRYSLNSEGVDVL